MKPLYIILIVLSLISFITPAHSQDTVTNTITNFNITDGGTKFHFDIYLLRNTPAEFKMGSSSFYFRYNGATMNTPVISYINPKYTVGSPTNSYNAPFTTINGSASRIGVQLDNISGTPGDDISNDPGFNGNGEKLATVTLNIVSAVTITLYWDELNSAVVKPGGGTTAVSRYSGIYNGTLPVELAGFNAAINRNNVQLNWSTANEQNNRGFEVERKLSGDNNIWNKVAFIEGSGNSDESKSYTYRDNNLTAGKYNYRLKQVDYNGNYEYYELQNEVVIGVPVKFELNQNYPNPFNPTTKINFSLPVDTKITLSVYDISGRLVASLINNEFRTADYYTVDFNGSNLASGVYFYTIQTGKFTDSKKMILVK